MNSISDSIYTHISLKSDTFTRFSCLWTRAHRARFDFRKPTKKQQQVLFVIRAVLVWKSSAPPVTSGRERKCLRNPTLNWSSPKGARALTATTTATATNLYRPQPRPLSACFIVEFFLKIPLFFAGRRWDRREEWQRDRRLGFHGSRTNNSRRPGPAPELASVAVESRSRLARTLTSRSATAERRGNEKRVRRWWAGDRGWRTNGGRPVSIDGSLTNSEGSSSWW